MLCLRSFAVCTELFFLLACSFTATQVFFKGEASIGTFLIFPLQPTQQHALPVTVVTAMKDAKLLPSQILVVFSTALANKNNALQRNISEMVASPSLVKIELLFK